MKQRCWVYALVALLWFSFWLTGCRSGTKPTLTEPSIASKQETQIENNAQPDQKELIQLLQAKYKDVQPQQWGETVSGVAFGLSTEEKVLALTFDACGGSAKSSGFDEPLIKYLEQMQVPATLFISGMWIDSNPVIFQQLAHINLFEIENHGLNHLPCSISGKSAYNIKGTGSVAEVVKEVDGNGQKIEVITGHKPRFYRSGTNYYDELAVAIAGNLGYQAVGYGVLGDAGATFNRDQVKKALLGARAGSIVIFHFNHPEGDTCEGIMEAIPILKDKGFRFVRLSEFPVKVYP